MPKGIAVGMRDKEAQKITVRFIIGTLTLKTEDGNKGRESLGR